jgi:hypothetical protein
MQLEPRQRTWLYLAAFIGVAQPLVAFDCYALFLEPTAHTSLPTRWLAWAMLSVAAVAAVALWAERASPLRVHRVLAAGILLMGLLGAANVAAFEHFNVLMDYEIWVHDKRMPAKYAPPGTELALPPLGE